MAIRERRKRIYRKRIPYGMQNFEDIRERDCYYVDKTAFIEDIEDSNMYFFYIRPRRFGKSLTLSMLEHYYGKVDYPVSFMYIKSTEGRTIRNRYYAADYAAARRHGIPVGAYHFFSPKSSGTVQADFSCATRVSTVATCPLCSILNQRQSR